MNVTNKLAGVDVPASAAVSQVLLGAGGRSPGVGLFDLRTGATENVLQLPEGDSAYRMGRTTDGQSVVVGTKGGRLYWIDLMFNEESPKGQAPIKRAQGAPVLGILVTDAGQALVCDSAGRMLLWEPRGEQPPSMIANRNTVCALSRFGEQFVAGLSISGEMLILDLAEMRLVKTIPAPSPPRWSALVDLIDWRKAEGLVYSASDGDLVLIRQKSEDVARVKAHEGPFYAVTVYDDHLLTFGFHDAVLRKWNPASLTIDEEFPIPRGVLAAAIATNGSPKLVLVCQDGGGGVFDFESSRLHQCQALPNNAYRCAIGPSWIEIVKEQEARRRVEVDALVDQIRHASSQEPSDARDNRHNRLAQLGYEHVSLALHAERARSQENLADELRSYHKLVRLVDTQPRAAQRSLGRYSQLLERFGQFKDAMRSYKTMGAWDATSAARADQLLPWVKALENRDACLELGLSPDVLLDGVAAVDGALTCHLITNVFPSPSLAAGAIEPDAIVQKYELIRRSSPAAGPPARIANAAPWITHDRIETVDIIFFADERPDSPSPFVFGLKVLHDVPQTILVPFLAIDGGRLARAPKDGRISEISVVSIAQDDRMRGWLRPVQAIVKQALQRLLTEELSQRT